MVITVAANTSLTHMWKTSIHEVGANFVSKIKVLCTLGTYAASAHILLTLSTLAILINESATPSIELQALDN
uniref:Uncharacterized protein n=1 Tax=Glossina austeni TaxID=7395 RepID=A0A1A9VTM0_GLOAU